MPLELKGSIKPGQADRRYYMIRVQVDGRRVPISTGTRDRKTAERKEQLVVNALRENPAITKDQLVALIRGANTPTHRAVLRTSSALNLKDAITACWASRKVWGNIKSRASHTSNLKRITTYFGEERHLSTITDEQVEAFAEHLLDDGMQPGGADRVLAVFQRLTRAAAEMPGGPARAPTVHLFGENRVRIYTLTYEEERRLFDAVRARSNKGAEDCYALFQVLVETGMRLGEALNLRWGDIEFKDEKKGTGTIRLWRVNELKTKASQRTLATTPTCAAAIQRMRHNPTGPFSSITDGQVHTLWNHAKDDVGIDDPDCVPHCCRHTFATRLLEETGDLKLVQQWLGHASITTTARVYAKVLVPRMMDAATILAKRRGT